MKNSIKTVFALVCICAAVSLMLAVTNYITAPIIERNQNASTNDALLEVLPDGKSFTEVDLSEYSLPSTVTQAFKAENGGFAIKLTTTGYSSGMIVLCGINPDNTVCNAVCLSSNETLGHEKTYGANFSGKNSEEVDAVDSISGATKTTVAYRSAIKDALNTATILGGGSVDIRTDEEILRDNLDTALSTASGEFEKMFFVEVIDDIDAVYVAKNGAGTVCVIGEEFIAADADGVILTACSQDTNNSVQAAITKINATALTNIDITQYEGLPSHLVSAQTTATGNYVLEMKAAGYGITGGDEYHPASGEYILVRVSLTEDGQIIDCLTVSQAETDGFGSACADEAFYGQFDGKTEENFLEIDAISGATMTTDGYKKAIARAFDSLKILKGGAN